MVFTIGVVLFALGIFVSVCLHEAGHMGFAKLFGIKVTKYFAGFGPTIFSFKRGETEYGLKAIPAGGFVKIIGMTPLEDEEEVAEEDKHRVFWRKPLWQRTVVLVAGTGVQAVLGFIILWIVVSFIGVANPAVASAAEASASTATVAVAECVPPADASADYECTPSDRPGPAYAAGIKDGDRIVDVNGTAVSDWDSMAAAIQPLSPDQPATITVQRGEETRQFTVSPYPSTVVNEDGSTETVAKIGVGVYVDPAIPGTVTYGAVDGVGQAVVFSGDMAVGIGQAVVNLPNKIPALWDALTGGERDPETPISVVGASRLGGELAEQSEWATFLILLAVLNYFMAVFNLLPLLPLDGGHVAIAWFERARSWLYAKMRKPDPGRVDYLKLMPVTYVVIIIFAAFTLLTVATDIINPISIK